MKKVIRLTESDLTNIVKKVISEQTEEKGFIRAVQNFLNKRIKANLMVDGKTGPNSKTEAAIMKYQSMIGATPDGDWKQETWSKMSESDKKVLKQLVAKEGGLIDQFLNWIGIY